MIKIFFLILVLSVSLESRANIFKDHFFNERPQNWQYQTSEGSRFDLPIHYNGLKALLLFGDVSLAAAKKLLAPSGLHAVPMSKNGTQIMIYAVDYYDCSIAPYKEVILFIPASKRPLSGGQLKDILFSHYGTLSTYIPFLKFFWKAPSKEIGFWVQNIAVDNQMAQMLGIEAWGFPKKLGRFESSFGKYQTSFKETELYQLSMIKKKKKMDIPLLLSGAPKSYTKIGSKLYESQIEVKTKATYSKFNSDIDTFTYNPASDLGMNLDLLQFKPKMWLEIHGYGAGFFKQ